VLDLDAGEDARTLGRPERPNPEIDTVVMAAFPQASPQPVGSMLPHRAGSAALRRGEGWYRTMRRETFGDRPRVPYGLNRQVTRGPKATSDARCFRPLR